MKTILVALVSTFFAVAVGAQQRPSKKMVAPGYQPTTYSSSYSSSSDFLHEVDLNLSQGYFRSAKVGSSTVSDLSILGSYSYDFGQQIQVGADVGLRSLDSLTRFTLAATGTYNLNPDYANSLFFKGGVGFYPVFKVSASGNLDNKNELGIFVSAGKRFKIWEHVNYKPSIMILKVSDIDPELTLLFLNISLNTNVF